ncbi:hypothetical protein IW261DRAFT_1412937 [Armillaria novae-zelandiae]|uniref:Uncharacterized protein n=1 Tax=Armillaria novae-zelandiae TaxID=153914 RepID=A0AA39PU04_9AGAR|nr:hypothetical protein IW261DRAFT_1412937 [Armillaria novae-zelandiae]
MSGLTMLLDTCLSSVSASLWHPVGPEGSPPYYSISEGAIVAVTVKEWHKSDMDYSSGRREQGLNGIDTIIPDSESRGTGHNWASFQPTMTTKYYDPHGGCSVQQVVQPGNSQVDGRSRICISVGRRNRYYSPLTLGLPTFVVTAFERNVMHSPIMDDALEQSPVLTLPYVKPEMNGTPMEVEAGFVVLTATAASNLKHRQTFKDIKNSLYIELVWKDFLKDSYVGFAYEPKNV